MKDFKKILTRYITTRIEIQRNCKSFYTLTLCSNPYCAVTVGEGWGIATRIRDNINNNNNRSRSYSTIIYGLIVVHAVNFLLVLHFLSVKVLTLSFTFPTAYETKYFLSY